MTMSSVRKSIGAGVCALLAIQVFMSGCGNEQHGMVAVEDQGEAVSTPPTEGVVRIPVTREQVTRFGIMIAPAAKGTLERSLRVYGEVTLDPDRVARVVLPASGIVREVVKTIGDRVAAGETLAWIESAELASAKAAYRAAAKIHARETRLRGSEINSVQDLLMAETALVQAQARLHALLGSAARFDAQTAYTEAVQEPQIDASHAATETLRPAQGSDARFAGYALTAPFAGTVVERNIARGESVDTRATVFTIADLSRVWIALALGQASVADVRIGQAMTIQLPAGATYETSVQYVSPLVDPETRTVTVRATVNNDEGHFRPGAFIEGVIQIPSERETVLVPKDAVQRVYDHTCVFIWNAGAFELREVQTGSTDGKQVEILQGLQAGERVAAVNAFHLKAELIKSAAGDMGAHHGHAH